MKIVIFDKPKIKERLESSPTNFVDFYRLRNLGYGIRRQTLKKVRTIQDVILNVVHIRYERNKPIPSCERVIGKLQSILLFDKSFLRNVARIRNLIKRNKKVLLKHYRMTLCK